MDNNINFGITSFWHYSVNYGDQLTPYIIEKISGHKAIYTPQSESITTVMVTGSILSSNVKNSVIWGNGFAWSHEDVHKPLKICAVRGNMTRARFLEKEIDCPDIVGDPALLLPMLYNPQSAKKYKLGIIPHVIDYQNVASKYFSDDEVLIINLADPIEKVIYDINTCEKTISSSLHGLITSHAYGIDSLWVKFSDKIIGDGFKYMDYFSSVGIDQYKAVVIDSVLSKGEILSMIPDHKIVFDTDKLYSSCPFK